MNRIIALASRQQSGNISALIEIDPESPHRIVHTGKDAHWHVTWIIADEHLVDFQDRAKLFIERLRRDVRQIEIDLVLAIDAHAGETNLKDFSRGDVTGNQIAIGGIFLFEEIPTLVLGKRHGRPLLAVLLRRPDAGDSRASGP